MTVERRKTREHDNVAIDSADFATSMSPDVRAMVWASALSHLSNGTGQ